MANVVNYDAGEVFSGRSSGNLVKGWDAPCESTPVNNPDYVFPVWGSDIIMWLMHSTEPLYVFGPTGCGKTTCVKQVVQRLNYPVYEITAHSRLEFPEMVGHHTVQNGSMSFAYGPLAMAMKYGGIFLLNEMDLLDPATAAGLNSVLDGSPLTIPENGGEFIRPHEMFRFVATANSNGGGDQSGMYQGVLRQNVALLDRFCLVEANYLVRDVEVGLVEKVAPSLPKDVIEKMVDYANAVRKLFIGESTNSGEDTPLEVTFSTRALLRWAKMTVLYQPLRHHHIDVVEYALDRALAFRASPSSRLTLKELKQRVF